MKIRVGVSVELTLEGDVKTKGDYGIVTFGGNEQEVKLLVAQMSNCFSTYGRLQAVSTFNQVLAVLEQIKALWPFAIEDPLPDAPDTPPEIAGATR